MNGVTNILLFVVSCLFTQNVVFVRLLGACDLGENRRVEVAAGYGLAMTMVMTLASALTWMVEKWALMPLGAEYLRIPAFVLVILLVSLLAARLAVKLLPVLAESLNDSFPHLAANCAVLGIAILNLEAGYGLSMALLSGFLGGLGFLIAIVLMSGVQERLEFSKVPEALKGIPIALISASLIALAFSGFAGLG